MKIKWRFLRKVALLILEKKKIKRQKPPPCPWPNLPNDIIISFILNRLNYIDQLRFRAVCKGWRVPKNIHGIKSADKLPWIMSYNSHSCSLYDLSYNQNYTVPGHDHHMIKYFNISDASILDSKFGWVLFWNKERIFFYSPFHNNKIIKLPNLYAASTFLCDEAAATFSASPVASDDCVIFLLSLHDNKYCINLCKPKDKKWTTLWFDGNYGSFCDVEYMDGVFYCSFTSRDTREAIGTFNVALKEWKIIYPHPLSGAHVFARDRLIEIDGNLFIIYQSSNFYLYRHRFLFLDRLRMEWLDHCYLKNRTFMFFDAAYKVSICIPLKDKPDESYYYAMHWLDGFCYFVSSSCFSNYCLCHSPCPTENCGYDWDNQQFKKIWIQPPPLNEDCCK